MDDLFRKTINYFNTPGSVDDDFVGQIVEVGAIKLKILKKIAEGKKLEKKFTTNRNFSSRHQKILQSTFVSILNDTAVSLSFY